MDLEANFIMLPKRDLDYHLARIKVAYRDYSGKAIATMQIKQCLIGAKQDGLVRINYPRMEIFEVIVIKSC